MTNGSYDKTTYRRAADKRRPWWIATIGSLIAAAWVPLLAGFWNYAQMSESLENTKEALIKLDSNHARDVKELKSMTTRQWERISPLNTRVVEVVHKQAELERRMDDSVRRIENSITSLDNKVDALLLRNARDTRGSRDAAEHRSNVPVPER